MWRPVNLCGKSKAAEISPSAVALPVASVLVLVPLVFQLYSIEIFLGSVLIVLGSAATMVFLEGVQGTWRKWLRAGMVGIILALGSYVTSDGIDRREQYVSDRDALVSLNIDRVFNGLTLDVLSCAYQGYRITGNLGFMLGYTPLRFSQAYLVLNTTTIVAHDHELGKAIHGYIMSGELLASELRNLEELCSGLAAKSKWTKDVIQEIFGEKGTLNDFLKRQQDLESLITSRYQWSNKDVWNRLDQPLFNKMKARLEAERLILDMRTKKPETGPEKGAPQQ